MSTSHVRLHAHPAQVPGVFHVVFGPSTFLLGFHDPLHPEFTDALHEWFFRSGLDHLVWIFGMLCAFLFPWFDRQLQQLEELPSARQTMYKAALVGGTLAVGTWWTVSVFLLPKRDYNKLHPFTSFIPIFCYMVLRNCSPTLRRYHMHLFAWCGKVTLETYILQFHIWMKTTGINGTPRRTPPTHPPHQAAHLARAATDRVPLLMPPRAVAECRLLPPLAAACRCLPPLTATRRHPTFPLALDVRLYPTQARPSS